jgi:GNAT superfamily N-acetyltransferase
MTAIFERVRGDYCVSTDSARLDLDAIHRFLRDGTYWAYDRPREVIAHSLQHSLAFGLYHGAEQVGLVRVVTDYATFAWLCDVYVDEPHRGQGLGKWLIECVVEHPALCGLKLMLLATRDAHGLYAQYGFTPLPTPETWMVRRLWFPDPPAPVLPPGAKPRRRGTRRQSRG